MSLVPGNICLDITRTVSRAGAGAPSGVDRVERAYIRQVMKADRSYFLSRILGGFALLDSAGMQEFLHLADAGDGLDPPDMLSSLGRRQTPGHKRAESTIRRLALLTVRRTRLAAMLKADMQDGFTYLTTGHSNQTAFTYSAIRAGGAHTIATLLHDVIPLDFPEYTRPEAVPRFETQFRTMAEASDLLIHNSAYTAERAAHWLDEFGLAVPGVTALLGCDPLPLPTATAAASPPTFVTLGTIEPRKNHLLLLNVWRRFHDTLPPEKVPHLHIVGRRGWENENIVDILDRAPFMGRTVFEHGFLSDEDLGALLSSATALLFPSFVEGFGYPLVEAVQMRKPCIAADLPPFREIAGDHVNYLDPLDGPGWAAEIMKHTEAKPDPAAADSPLPPLPSWDNHFRTVAHALAALNEGQG
ncbi:glycosyltransferase family 4 protein [Algicella marina]|uniref:Glycosyltransferase n=1 Tax=Algicella marina TaxID=2683284 RepID=A0A6P1T591_9RHOB|nr:glycosyltransferase family 1 protein [Algicella marina]QHQ36843.1 glycosyltransferase [Algicella marina]